MHHLTALVAQSAAPELPAGTPAWAVGVIAILLVVSTLIPSLIALLVALRSSGKVESANVNATSAKATADATQESVTRLSNRQNALTESVVKHAVYATPPGQSPAVHGTAAPRPYSPGAMLPMVLLCLAPAMLLGGCAGIPSAQQIPADWVKADRDTYNAVAPEYVAYTDADPSLSAFDRQQSRTTVETWDRRLEAREKSLSLPTQKEALPAPTTRAPRRGG